MSLTSMCNINMLYFAIAVFVCIFVSGEFKSGYCKNLFTVRAKKTDYVVSKTLVGFVGGGMMLIAFFLGALLGGGIAGLPFAMEGFQLLCCMLAKIFIALLFVAVCLLASVVGKQKAWLSLLLALGFGMLFFTVIPMVTPLDSTPINLLLSLVGGIVFAVGIGAITNQVLKKTSLL